MGFCASDELVGRSVFYSKKYHADDLDTLELPSFKNDRNEVAAKLGQLRKHYRTRLLRYDVKNMQYLCRNHHIQKTNGEIKP